LMLACLNVRKYRTISAQAFLFLFFLDFLKIFIEL
jgi:hypothetical protein